MKKYILTDETKEILGITLHRIQAVRDFGRVKAGDLGGWIQSERNLSHDGNAWVSGDAQVDGSARVGGIAQVDGIARVGGNAWVSGDARVSSNRDFIVFKNWWSSGRYFTWTRSNDMYLVGCFHGTGEELIAKAYRDSELSGREYERIVKYVNEIKL